MHSFLEKAYEALFTLFTSTKRTLPLNWFVIKWTEHSKTLFAEIRFDGLKETLPLWIRVSLILLASLHARAFARRRKAWFYLRMCRILVTAKHRWTTLRMSRPLFVGSYLQVTWWALGLWKGSEEIFTWMVQVFNCGCRDCWCFYCLGMWGCLSTSIFSPSRNWFPCSRHWRKWSKAKMCGKGTYCNSKSIVSSF